MKYELLTPQGTHPCEESSSASPLYFYQTLRHLLERETERERETEIERKTGGREEEERGGKREKEKWGVTILLRNTPTHTHTQGNKTVQLK